MRYRATASLCILLSLSAAASAGIVPVNGSAPDGRSYSDLAANWWQWALSIPANENPLTDSLGVDAWNGQSGNVFFLAPSIGNEYTREVIVLANQHLFFPLVTFSAFNAPGETMSADELKGQVTAATSTTSTLYALLDEQQLPDPWNYRAATGAFQVTLPNDNIYSELMLPGGTYSPAFADGFWMLMEPLSEGRHVLRFDGGTGDPANYTYFQSVTYVLSVVVPEPASLIWLAAGAILGLRRRK